MDKNTLNVLYCTPQRSFSKNAVTLSFMQPDDEDSVSGGYKKFLYGRKEMNKIREKARNIYVDIVARIGATKCGDQTLRQALRIKGIGNPWWYHKISEKQSEGDSAFNELLQTLTILDVAERNNINKVNICGGSRTVANIVKTKYKTCLSDALRSKKYSVFIGILSRIKGLLNELFMWQAIRSIDMPQRMDIDVSLQGFWDWSLKRENNKITDIYFKALPREFINKNIKYAWFLWFDPYSRPGSRNRTLSKILKNAIGDERLIFVQHFLGIKDVIAAFFDLRPVFKYIQFKRNRYFWKIFNKNNLDLKALFKDKLIYYFLDSSMPHYYLMEKAYKKAFEYYKPKASLAFLDLFLAARAFYQGASLSGRNIKKFDMQHASYGREKTFILADGLREVRGEPDGIAMPAPDTFFVMGELCREILLEDGFDASRIFVSGSARYDHVKLSNKKSFSNPIKILLVPTLNLEYELEMVRAAIRAAHGLNVELFLRSHPAARMEDMPSFKRHAKNISSSDLKLEEDLARADLVIFSYSTVAEESQLRGIPVLQWQGSGYNASVFRDMGFVRSASTVKDLRNIFKSFADNPEPFRPTTKEKEVVINKCFFKIDGKASVRICDAVEKVIR